MSMPLTVGQRQPTAAIVRGNVVLIYTYDSYLYKRIFPYGTTAWEAAAAIVVGDHPSLADQSGLLWLSWHEVVGVDRIYYATSTDGGRNFSAPTIVCNDADLPGICLQYDGFIGVAYRNTITGNVLYRTERTGFAVVTTVSAPTSTVSHITMCNHLNRIFVGWIEGETAKYKYSTDHGITWSMETTLGTYTWLTMLSLPTDHLLAVTEYHHVLQGLASRNDGVTWDLPHTLWLPESALEPCLLLDSYQDVVVFSAELDIDTFNSHTYTTRVRDLPFYGFRGEILDTWGPLNIS